MARNVTLYCHVCKSQTTSALPVARPQRQTNAETSAASFEHGDLDQLKSKDTIQKTVD